MLHISLFSGIGGFDLAAEWMGWTNIVSCEINDFCNKVLEHYWPNAYHHRDVKTLTLETINKELGENWRTDDVILTGGFPCQPYSSAGKRKGKEDERHLWPEMLRVIREIKPSYIVGENVAGLLSWSGGLVFDEVHSDLEAEGYEVQAVVIPAAAVNAPHGRDRVWFVARNAEGVGDSKIREILAKGKRNQSDSNTIGICNDDAPHSDNPRTDIGMPSKQEWQEGNIIGRFTQSEPWQAGRNGTASDTISTGLQYCTKNRQIRGKKIDAIEERDKFTLPIKTICNGCKSKWDNFPTVSPVCSRNDGISHQLDGITFSKWRKESIKAAGNAVVPQVVYQIFKAIEATRK